MDRAPDRPPHPEKLWGIDLRYVLTDLICSPPARVWRVRDLVAALTDAGFELGARPSKVVSDVLRSEVRRGRVRRVGWGEYVAGRAPESTRRRIRERALRRRRWLAELRLEADRAELEALLLRVRR